MIHRLLNGWPDAAFHCSETHFTDQMPEVNFSMHCWDPVSHEHPNLYRCRNIEEGIKACQAAGKKVLISLGGGTGNNDLNDAKAIVLAQNLWDLFLEGKGQQNIRPFGRFEKNFIILLLFSCFDRFIG